MNEYGTTIFQHPMNLPDSGFHKFRIIGKPAPYIDAKAYQQEQSAALTLTSALVVLNGVFVCLIALAVFGSLTWIIESAVLW